MGITNIRYGLEEKIGRFRGELEAKRAEVKQIENGVLRLSDLHTEITELEALIKAAEAIIKHDCPDWKPERVKTIRPNTGRKLFKSGEIGRTALAILRESNAWLRPRDIARQMLEQIGEDITDRAIVDSLTNSIGNYFTKHRGELVESRGDFAKEWQVIR